MYGLIQQGLKDMVCRSFGFDVWLDICREAKCENVDFEILSPYPDSLTSSILEQTAKRLNLSREEVLVCFGKHWVKFTASEGYGPILDLFGKNFKGCLNNLNRMHGHMGAMMPELKPPRFSVVERDSSSLTLHYYSQRCGLAPMVQGLLEGLAERFAENARIVHIPSGARSDHDEFDIELSVV